MSKRFQGMAIAAVLLFAGSTRAEGPGSDRSPYRYYFIDCVLFSLGPNGGISDYRNHSQGGVGPSGTLGLAVADKHREFEVSIVPMLKSSRLVATVAVTPSQTDRRTKSQTREFDLSDLNPRTVEIAKNDDGSIYRLNLVPKIVDLPIPKAFKAADLRLEYWRFSASPIVVNDEDYMGQMSLSMGPLAWLDFPGFAKVEFSLLRLVDSTPSGVLENGIIKIGHEGKTITISNVKNGMNADVLPGGPYQVWVRWKKPTQTVEEFRQASRVQIAELKERVKKGELSLPAGSLERLEAMSKSDRIRLMSSGVGPVRTADLAP